MFVIIVPSKNKTYGSFATFEEARIWGEDHTYHAPFLSDEWYINQVEQVQSDCAMQKSSREPNGDGDCC